MLAPWVIEEMASVDLEDARLNARIKMVLTWFAERPSASIPAACGGYAETASAYRLFDNPAVDFDSVLAPHAEATRRRIAAQPVALLVQDTTELDLTRPAAQVKGAGPLDAGPRRGLFLHLMHAFAPDGTPLGTVRAEHWARDPEAPTNAESTRAERAATPIEEKESHRWLEGIRTAREVAEACPGTRIVCVADSESDIDEVIAEGMASPRPADWIVRACQDRATVGAAAARIREAALATPVLATEQIEVRGRQAKLACETRGRRQPRESRSAEVEIRAATVTLRGPWRPGGDLPDVTVNVVLVREVSPPEGDVPVEWLLLTSLPIDSAERVRDVIAYYRCRWMAEVFFRTLKSGCRVEGRRFETLERLLPCLAIYLIVAWRTLYVCRLGRGLPEIGCDAVFSASEWKSVWVVVRREPPPASPPPLREMVRLVAQLGGYVNRKTRADEPGPQTLWLGLQRMHDHARCWDIFGPGAGPKKGFV